ncbi:MAG: lipopolysaccharide biosynthesis protein [Xanthobacteraceae bacterium]
MAVSESESVARKSLGRLVARGMAWLADQSDRSVAQRIAGTAFLIRVANAGVVFITQILLARWMGRFEFGVYVSVWAWVTALGPLAPLGVAYSATRFIPEYRARHDDDGLRGFLSGSRRFCFATGTIAAVLVAGGVLVLGDRLPAHQMVPFLIACIALPIFTLSAAQDGIARSFNWIDLALGPTYVIQPLLILAIVAGIYLLGGPATAVAMLATACAAMWTAVLVQLIVLQRRIRSEVAPGPRRYELGVWLRTALPIFLVDSFFYLLFSVDILILQAFVNPQDVAVYYAATKTLALIHFIYFAVGAASAHRFSEYHVAGDRGKLESFIADTTRWMFWPSVALGFVLVVLGKPILMLFGTGFEAGYPLICIIMVGLLARASVGPAERVLNMTGQQSACAFVYATALAVNVALCFLLIPRFGLTGAAAATATAVVVESGLLLLAVKRRLGVTMSVFAGMFARAA